MARQKITTPEIIGIAINIFRNHGYHGTSMSMLAEACGLMKGSFYNHFRSKDDILIVAIKSLNEYLNQRVFSIAYEDEMKPQERMKAILEKLSAVLRYDQGGCLVGNMTLELYHSEPKFQPSLNQYYQDWVAAFEHIFATSNGPKTSLKLARQSVQEFEGAIMMGRVFDDQDMIDDASKQIVAKLG